MISMKQGILPKELNFLYALCLIGKGDNNFLAQKMLQGVIELQDIDLTHESTSFINTSLEDSSWLVFKNAMIEPMDKSTALAFTSDLVHKINKEDEWTNCLLDLFQQHIYTLDRSGEIDLLLKKQTHKFHTSTTKRIQILKILVGIMRLKLLKAEYAMRNWEKIGKEEDMKKAVEHGHSIINDVNRFGDTLWQNASSDGILKPTSISVSIYYMVSNNIEGMYI